MSDIDLRLGDWREVLADVGEVDAVITDPPYGERVHGGQRTGSSTRKTTLSYEQITEPEVAAAAARIASIARWWVAVFSDHKTQVWWERHLEGAGLYVFAPVWWVRECPTPRFSGDGPASPGDYITVARPRHRIPSGRSGSRPSRYVSPHTNGAGFAAESTHPGSKMIAPMRALVRDYTLPGDTVCDPFAGSGTTLIAAAMEGRRAIGAEIDPETHAKAMRRISAGYTPTLF